MRSKRHNLLPVTLTVLLAFWLIGMFLFRSQLWLPWLALLAAVALTTRAMFRSP